MTTRGKKEFLTTISVAEKDVQSLLDRSVALFDQNDGLRFEFFQQIWQEMRFPWIFLGQDNFRDVYELTEDLLTLIKGHLILADNDFALRAASLYTLYGVYWKQPIRPRLRIRLNKDEYTSCQTFIEECREEQHWDLIYCWTRLLSNYAVEFTGPSVIMGVEAGVTWETRSSQDQRILAYKLNPFSSNEIQSCFGRIAQTHQHYMTIRNALRNVDPQSEAGLSLVSEDLPEALEAIQDNIAGGGTSSREKGPGSKKMDEGQVEETSPSTDETGPSIGDRRQRLIQGAFATGGETSRQKQLKTFLPDSTTANDPDYNNEEEEYDQTDEDSEDEEYNSSKRVKKPKKSSPFLEDRRGTLRCKDQEGLHPAFPPNDRLEMELAKAESRLKIDISTPFRSLPKVQDEDESTAKPKGQAKDKAQGKTKGKAQGKTKGKTRQRAKR
ncbi:snRNA-activating protein complex subunit 1-like [Tigriopus californicus]|uniref:snRNA-activating protein complex subunit 1-like n=1 Tax=Tigriopus californicus TaxID=6832 RepID=UPI0027DA8ECD|nr:snRNA-activating protein complex subunit 1-like [Tigriopus californicus]